MSSPSSRSFIASRRAYDLRWLVLIVILLGMVVSSFGSTVSHGIAAIALAGADTSAFTDTQNGHRHEHVHHYVDAQEHPSNGNESALSLADDGAPLEHPHHGADHSHDPAHALMAMWGSLTSEPPRWLQGALPWVESMQPYRLERPPIA